VNNAQNFAYVLRTNSSINIRVMDYLERQEISYRKERMDDISIYYDLNPLVRPEEMIDKCSYMEGLKILEQ
jgi:hypothetical protein